MNQFVKENWKRILHVVGVALFVIGTIDPLEGSVLIMAGTILLATLGFIDKKPNWKIFFIAAILIIIGVFFLFYLSSLGGFGGSSTLSWWYGLLILPYPIGWLSVLVLLIHTAFKNRKQQIQNKNE